MDAESDVLDLLTMHTSKILEAGHFAYHCSSPCPFPIGALNRLGRDGVVNVAPDGGTGGVKVEVAVEREGALPAVLGEALLGPHLQVPPFLGAGAAIVAL